MFGPDGDLPLDSEIVRQKFAALAEEIRTRTGNDRTPEQVAQGFLAIAVEKMASAIKKSRFSAVMTSPNTPSAASAEPEDSTLA